MNIPIIARVLGALLVFLALFWAYPLGVAWFHDEPLMPWYIMNGVSILGGLGLMAFGLRARDKDMSMREGIAVTSLAWVAASLVSALGIQLAVPEATWMMCWFEAMSGFTTTGSSVFGSHIVDGQEIGVLIGELPKGVLMWRSLMQWMGGLGIVVFSLAIIPLLMGGSAGFQMYRAEVPGLTADRLAPRLASTARILLSVYCILTIVVAVALFACGVSPFVAINHACTTIASGGFSTYDDSVGGMNSAAAEWVIIVGMFAAGLNFSLLIGAIRGRLKRIWDNTEARVYILLVLSVWLIIMGIHSVFDHEYANNLSGKVHELARDSLFQIVSLVTSTGYGTGFEHHPLSWDSWPGSAKILLLGLMICGGCAGSTAGGAKLVRFIVAWKACRRELRRYLEPARVTPISLDGHPIPDRMVLQVVGFLMIYFASWLVGTFMLTLLGNDLNIACSAALTALSNIGPGIESIGPAGNFRTMNDASLGVSVFLMLLGRLEFFGVLITLMPRHWRK